jgi:hypothetical protein
MQGNCANCGGCEHADICDHCGHCRNCGKPVVGKEASVPEVSPSPITVKWPHPNTALLPSINIPVHHAIPQPPYIGDPIPPNYTICGGTQHGQNS